MASGKLIRYFLPYGLLKFKEKHWYSPAYFGNTVYCPCCGRHFGRFKDSGYDDGARELGSYENTICPFCHSSPRYRMVCWYFEQNTASLPQNRKDILMFAPEHSITGWFVAHDYHYTSIDLFDKGAHILADIQQTPFLDETWSLIICNHVLEHVADYRKALAELRRILKKDGILEITVPADRALADTLEDSAIITEEERKAKYGQEDHLRLFGNNFKDILAECGFVVELLDGGDLPENIIAKTGPSRFDDNRLYICRKA